ncbi:MAG: ABC transporter permease [Ancalomicrobiaceae bacterium]|nr:ABC transporter permease [Ancalomicrobiaceae bacterium]
MNPLPMVMADLRAMRGSALLSIVLIALAVAIGVAIGAQERAIRGASARAADDFPLLIGAPASSTQLVLTSVYLQPEALTLMDGALLAKLASDPRVDAVAPIAFGDVVLGYPVVGTTAEFVSRWGKRAVAEGRNFAAEGEAVVGADVRLALGQAITPSHGVAGQHRHFGQEDDEEHAHRHAGVSYTVVGRLPRLGSPWDRAILIPVESVWETHGLGNGHTNESHIGAPFEAEHVPGVPALVVKPKQVFQAYQLRSDYRKAGLMAVFPAEILVSLYQTVGDIRDVLVVASALNNVLVFLAILMLLVTLVSLRRRRYAILRALGASRAYVALVVWLGAAVLLAFGAVAGLLTGFVGAHVVASLFAAETGLQLAIMIGAREVGLVALMALFGSLLALVPATIAWRRPVAESLRS